MSRQCDNLIRHPLIRPFLLPPWFAYLAASNLRHAGFDHGLRRPRRLPVPVIGIGNLTVGGTGKSPLVHLVAELCRQIGGHPAVISRGYRAGADGRNDEAADAPVPVYCHPRRLLAGRRAIADGHDCLIGDDLFQHRQLHRDRDLVCIDATRPWGEDDGRRGRLLPLGLMREGPTALTRADALIITRSDQIDGRRLSILARQLRHFGKPVLLARHAPSSLRDGYGEHHPADHLRGRAVLLASGLGNPAAFARSAADCGMRVEGHEIFPDHHHYDRHDCRRLLNAADRRPLVITSKDAVKLLPILPADQRRRLWVLEVAMRLGDDDLAVLRSLLADCLRPN